MTLCIEPIVYSEVSWYNRQADISGQTMDTGTCQVLLTSSFHTLQFHTYLIPHVPKSTLSPSPHPQVQMSPSPHVPKSTSSSSPHFPKFTSPQSHTSLCPCVSGSTDLKAQIISKSTRPWVHTSLSPHTPESTRPQVHTSRVHTTLSLYCP